MRENAPGVADHECIESMADLSSTKVHFIRRGERGPRVVLVHAIGFEWLWRLWQEPRRLWRRYLIHGPRFACNVALELSGLKRFD